MTTTFAYDLVTYESFPYPQTRPDRIATLADFSALMLHRLKIVGCWSLVVPVVAILSP
jgi:hypothetical protein